jgi:hypothetical protein
MPSREATTIPFSAEALKANLLRLQNEWATVQASHDRDAIYGYLAAVFELVLWWNHESKAVNQARRALRLRGYSSVREPEPFAAVILCTADRGQVDDRTRSKWSRALRYAAEFKDLDEPLGDFIKRKGGINECAARFARRIGGGFTSGSSSWARPAACDHIKLADKQLGEHRADSGWETRVRV